MCRPETTSEVCPCGGGLAHLTQDFAFFHRVVSFVTLQNVDAASSNYGGAIMTPDIIILIAGAVILMLIAFVLGMVTGVSLSRPIIR